MFVHLVAFSVHFHVNEIARTLVCCLYRMGKVTAGSDDMPATNYRLLWTSDGCVVCWLVPLDVPTRNLELEKKCLVWWLLANLWSAIPAIQRGWGGGANPRDGHNGSPEMVRVCWNLTAWDLSLAPGLLSVLPLFPSLWTTTSAQYPYLHSYLRSVTPPFSPSGLLNCFASLCHP